MVGRIGEPLLAFDIRANDLVFDEGALFVKVHQYGDGEPNDMGFKLQSSLESSSGSIGTQVPGKYVELLRWMASLSRGLSGVT